MKKTRLLTLLMAMIMMAMSPVKMWAISGSGSSSDPYLISSDTDWRNSGFVSALSKSSSSSKVHIYLMNDIEVSSVTLRDQDVYISLDGNGHNIKLNSITTTEENTGLFGKIGGGVVKDLRIGGALTSSKKYMGNLCGKVTGTLIITNVICSASLAYNNENVDDATTGGFIGQINGDVTFNQCGFTYRLYCNSKGKNMCGMVGYRSSGSVVFNNCFCKAEWRSAVSSDNYAYMRNDGSNTIYNNCYYVNIGTGGKVSDKSSGKPSYIAESKFGTGELAYLLNGETNGKSRWYQNLSGTKDNYPYPYTKTASTHALVYYGYDHGATSQTYNNSSLTKSSKHQFYNTLSKATWSNEATPASCKVKMEYKCSTCNATASEDGLTPTCVTTNATCKDVGTYTYTATSATYKKDASNYHTATDTYTFKNALGHAFNSTKDPHKTHCTRCGHSIIRYTATDKWVCYELWGHKPFSDASGNVVSVESHTFSSPQGVVELNGTVDKINFYAFTPKQSTSEDADDGFEPSVLTSIILPEGITMIGGNAFFYCKNLSSITLPSTLTTLDDGAFQYCGITSITIPDGVTELPVSAFDCCKKLVSVTVPNELTKIGASAFYKCESLKNFTIPNSVTSIGNGAFQGCSALTSITIPSGVTSIGNNTFQGCI